MPTQSMQQQQQPFTFNVTHSPMPSMLPPLTTVIPGTYAPPSLKEYTPAFSTNSTTVANSGFGKHTQALASQQHFNDCSPLSMYQRAGVNGVRWKRFIAASVAWA
jgi:hypothetical protein